MQFVLSGMGIAGVCELSVPCYRISATCLLSTDRRNSGEIANITLTTTVWVTDTDCWRADKSELWLSLLQHDRNHRMLTDSAKQPGGVRIGPRSFIQSRTAIPSSKQFGDWYADSSQSWYCSGIASHQLSELYNVLKQRSPLTSTSSGTVIIRSRGQILSVAILHIYSLNCANKKAQLSLTNPRDAKACQNCSNSTCLQRCRWQYWPIFMRFSCCYVRNMRNTEKFTENSNLWSSRSSKVIDLGANRKPICDLLLVIH